MPTSDAVSSTSVPGVSFVPEARPDRHHEVLARVHPTADAVLAPGVDPRMAVHVVGVGAAPLRDEVVLALERRGGGVAVERRPSSTSTASVARGGGTPRRDRAAWTGSRRRARARRARRARRGARASRRPHSEHPSCRSCCALLGYVEVRLVPREPRAFLARDRYRGRRTSTDGRRVPPGGSRRDGPASRPRPRRSVDGRCRRRRCRIVSIGSSRNPRYCVCTTGAPASAPSAVRSTRPSSEPWYRSAWYRPMSARSTWSLCAHRRVATRLVTDPSTASGSRCVTTTRASGNTARRTSSEWRCTGDLSTQRASCHRRWRICSTSRCHWYAGVMSHAASHATYDGT